MIPIPPYIPSWSPVPVVTPFTYRDGITMLKKVDGIIRYLNRIIVPFINETNQELADKVQEDINNMINVVNTAIADLETSTDQKLADMQATVDNAIAYVNTSVANLTTYVNQEIAANKQYVDDAVASIINNSVSVQDPVMAGIINNPASQSRARLDALYLKLTNQDSTTAGLVNDTNSATRTALNGIFPIPQRIKYPSPINIPALSAFRDILMMSRRNPCKITILGDSIVWGVGSDGLAASSTGALGPQQDKYRENAWPYQLSEKLNRVYGTGSVLGFVGPQYSDRPSTWAAAVTAALSPYGSGVGPFGTQAGTNKGGAIMQFGGTIDWDTNTLNRPFTELDVFVFGDTVTPATPTVYVDGVSVYTGVAITDPVADAFKKITITGLTDTLHTVQLKNTVTGGASVYGAFIVPRRRNGIVVNRIASSGATSTDAVPSARAITASVMKNYSDLLIIAFGTNDQIQQVPINTFKANLQSIIDASTCNVLLLDGPPVNAPAGTLKPIDYKNALIDLTTANSSKVAFASISDAMGKYTDARDRGMFATGGTVHPSWYGADVISDFVKFILTYSYN